MRVQLQHGIVHVNSMALTDDTGQGVSAAQVIEALEAMYAEFGNIPGGALLDARVALNRLENKILKAVPYGVSGGGNVLRETFFYRGEEWRWDVVNDAGHNLRR